VKVKDNDKHAPLQTNKQTGLLLHEVTAAVALSDRIIIVNRVQLGKKMGVGKIQRVQEPDFWVGSYMCRSVRTVLKMC
jgi:hypothetical protein